MNVDDAITRIEVARLAPGDVLICHIPADSSPEHGAAVSDALAHALPLGLHFLVVAEGVDFSVMYGTLLEGRLYDNRN